MEEKHYIEVIGVLSEDKLYRAYLKPGGKPEATFEIRWKNPVRKSLLQYPRHVEELILMVP